MLDPPDRTSSPAARTPAALAAERAPWLRGNVRVPGDRMAGALALALCAMARGESVIEGLSENRHALSHIVALRELGAHLDKRAGRWHVQGIGVGGFLEPRSALQVTGGESDLLLLGALGFYDFATRTDQADWQGPIGPLFELFAANAVRVSGYAPGTPLSLRGPRFTVPLNVSLPLVSTSLKAALLLAALAIPGSSRIVEPAASAAYPERMLRSFGARLDERTDPDGAHVIELSGLPQLRAQAIGIPADPALAAYPLAGAILTASSDVTVEAVTTDPARLRLIGLIEAMGGQIERRNPRRLGGEDVADLRASHSALSAIQIPPDAYDRSDAPLLAVLASFAQGDTLLGVRPGDTPNHALRRALAANGVTCQDSTEGLWVRGGTVPGGATVATRLDPGLAMSFLVMGMAAERPVAIDERDAMADLFPDFVAGFEQIGASFSEAS